MELMEDGCSVTAAQASAIQGGLAVFEAQPSFVVVTTDFVGVVAEMTDDPSYGVSRGGGVVGARTIPRAGGSIVVVNFSEVASQPVQDLERLLAHEGGHVVINARGTEETSGHRDADDSESVWLLKCVGALAMVELRIEHGLALAGYPAAETTCAADVDENLAVTNVEVVEVMLGGGAGTEPAYDDAISTLGHFTDHLAYVAAPLVAGKPGFSPSALSNLGQANWNDYVAPVWTDRLGLWGRVPAVQEPVDVGGWRELLRESVGIESRQLDAFGFALECPDADDYLVVRTASDQLFSERRARAQAQAE